MMWYNSSLKVRSVSCPCHESVSCPLWREFSSTCYHDVILFVLDQKKKSDFSICISSTWPRSLSTSDRFSSCIRLRVSACVFYGEPPITSLIRAVQRVEIPSYYFHLQCHISYGFPLILLQSIHSLILYMQQNFLI